MSELSFSIGGVRIAVRSDAPETLDSLRERCADYQSDVGAVDVLVNFTAKPDFRPSELSRRPYPAFTCRAESAHGYHFWRRDGQGTVNIPQGVGQPVVADFVGLRHSAPLQAGMRVAMSLALPRLGGLMLHSACVSTHAGAMLFAGPSGAGKSTITRLLIDASPSARALADDLTVLRPDANGTWCAWATPISGDLEPPPPSHAPVTALHFLVQAEHHHREPLAKAELVGSLLRNMLAYVDEQQAAARALSAAADFVEHVDGFVLRFAKDAKIAQLLGIS